MRSFARRNPCFALVLLLLPGVLLVEAGYGVLARLVELGAAAGLIARGAARPGLALAFLSVALLTRTEAAREARLAEVRAWTGQRDGLLELRGRAEARGTDGLGRPRLLFRVDAAADAGAPLLPRSGFVRLLLPRPRTPSSPGRAKGEDIDRRLDRGRTAMPAAQPELPPLGVRVNVRGRFRAPPVLANPGALRWELLPGGPRVRGSMTIRGWTPARGGRGDPMQSARRALSHRLEGLFSPLTGGFMRAALFGDRESLHPRLREVFSRTGTGHIVAISGMNVAILAAIGWAALAPFLRSPRLRRRVLAALLLLYVPLAGNSPSVARGHAWRRGPAGAVRRAARAGSKSTRPRGLLLLAFQPESLLDPRFSSR